MKPGIIKSQGMGHPQTLRLVRWLEANGLRHYVPEDARIICTGNRLIIPTLDIERVGQENKKWARNRWVRVDGEMELPIKYRTYRIRVPFEAIK